MATICIITMPKTVIENRLLAMCWLYLPFNYCFPICEIPDSVWKKSVTIFWRLGFISEVQSSVKSTHIDFGKDTDSISVQIYATNSRERLNFKCVVLPICDIKCISNVTVCSECIIFSLIYEKRFYKENNYYLFI